MRELDRRGWTELGRDLAFAAATLQLLVGTLYLGTRAGVQLFYFPLAGMLALVHRRAHRAQLAARLGVVVAGYLVCALLFTPENALVRLSAPVLDVVHAGSAAGAILLSGYLFHRFRAEIRHAEARLEQADADLRQLSSDDELTGVANRRALGQALEREWARAARGAQPIALLMCDVDHFAAYTDRYGHQEGDTCLVEIAQVLQLVVSRPGDVVARHGGEQFVLALPATDLEGALAVAEAIHEGVAGLAIPHAAAPTDMVTVSLGVCSTVPEPGEPVGAMLARAGELLHAARAAGRHRTAVAGPGEPVRIIEPGPGV